MKEQVIQIPDTLEVKEIKDGKIILIEKENKLTYEDIAKKLFKSKTCFYTNNAGVIKGESYVIDIPIQIRDNCISQKQAQKLLAINKLMNVAKYLNGDWQPDWNNDETKYFIQIEATGNDLCLGFTSLYNCSIVYFKSREFIKQTIEILGEDTIRLALCTDY